MLELIGGELYQWDKCRKIAIDDPEGKITEIHYARDCDNTCIVVTVKNDENGAKYAEIPNILLQSFCPVFAYAVNVQNGESVTIAASTFIVRQKGKPADYVYTETEVLCYRELEKRIKHLEEAAGFPEGGTGSPSGGTGKDGVSPTVEITATEDGHKVTVTDVNGAKSFDVKDGKDGKNGADGKTAYQYAKDGGYTGTEAEFAEMLASGSSSPSGTGSPSGGTGKDGVSPTVEITATEDGHTVTVTDVNGAKSFDVKDGKDGTDGKDGIDGKNGVDGKTAYQYAKDGGYTGTEAEFAEMLASGSSSPSGEVNAINPALNLLVMGDSLFGGENGKAWLKTLGCNMRNYGVSGSSIAKSYERMYSGTTVFKSVLTQWDNFTGKNGDSGYALSADSVNGNSDFTVENTDIILIDGGGNDYLYASKMGSLSPAPPIYAEATKDESTVIGALETLLRDISMQCPKAQKFFLIMHRVYQCGTDLFNHSVRRYWSYNPCFYRVKGVGIANFNTGEPTGEVTQTWEILFNQNERPLYNSSEIKSASKLFVRKYNETGSDYSWVRIDKASLYTDTTQTKFNTSLFQYYNYDALRENIIKVCNMYGVKVIDLYNESPLNVVPPTEVTLEVQKNPDGVDVWAFYDPFLKIYRTTGVAHTNTGGNNEEIHSSIRNNGYKVKVANLELFDFKHVHPTVLGYKIGYEPYIKQALSLGTKKT